MDSKQSFFKNRPACSSWIALVKPIHVHLFNFLVIFVSDQVHNQDNYLKVFKRLVSFQMHTNRVCNGLRLIETSTQSLLHPEGLLPENLGGGMRPAFQNPYPIYDQNG